jgi:UDP-N-acetylmuramate dehydrogenase
MRLGGNAKYLCHVTERNEVGRAITWANSQQLPVVMIGGGSNIVWQDSGFPGLVMVNDIKHYEARSNGEDGFYITIGSGEIWDEIVERTVKEGLSGIEALSLIPGKAGATPVQNVGAYGQEISQTLLTVEAYDREANSVVNLSAIDCDFSYRASRFNKQDKGRFFITAITLSLRKGSPFPPFYSSVAAYFEEHNISNPTPSDLRETVINIRNAKLPNPYVIANTGSFFSNPIVSAQEFNELKQNFNDIPQWETDGSYKIPAAWLIEQAGYKDVHDAETGMATWKAQPLVLVNESAKSTADLLKFKEKIVRAVQEKFGIILSQEPELLP